MKAIIATTAFLLIAAAGSCFEDCGKGKTECSSTESQAGPTVVPAGEGREFFRTCSTCGHASAQATWTAPATAGNPVRLIASYSCGLFAFQEHSSTTVNVTVGQAVLADLAVENICGVNSPVEWRFRVENQQIGTAKALEDVRVLINCPGSEPSSSNPVAPSRSG